MRPLTADLTRGDLRPYFLWDEDTTIDELRLALASSDRAERDRLLGKMLREARDVDVWHFVTPAEVAVALPDIKRIVGKRTAFWEWLVDRWRHHGFIR